MLYRRRRKRNVYTKPHDKLKAVERIMQGEESTRTISEELSVSLTSVQTWVKQYKDNGPSFFTGKSETVKDGVGIWVSTEEHEHLKELEKNYEDMQLQVEILKKFHTFLKVK